MPVRLIQMESVKWHLESIGLYSVSLIVAFETKGFYANFQGVAALVMKNRDSRAGIWGLLTLRIKENERTQKRKMKTRGQGSEMSSNLTETASTLQSADFIVMASWEPDRLG